MPFICLPMHAFDASINLDLDMGAETQFPSCFGFEKKV
jgi:hypothetical protein